ncbi:MAG: TonB-dependent receptor [Bacteroidales bacterium]|nr:TonB-dependent receptor [Bacteroidales bacterium]
MKKIIGLLLNFVCIASLNCQTTNRIFGYATDATTGEPIIGATLRFKNNSDGTSTNQQGYFSLTIKKIPDTLVATCIGYRPVMLSIVFPVDSALNIRFTLDTLNEVIVKRPLPEYLQKTQTSIEMLSSRDVKTLPVVMGESDITRTMHTLPGVVAGTENTAGFFVRGGSHDQNLILIDGVPLYHTYHLYGLFSVFNTDAINTTLFYRGGIPAQYNGRLSSVLDIRMNDGNNQKLSGQATLSPIASKVLFEGPIVKGKTSFLLTARRSMFDLLPKNITYNISWVSGIDQSKRDMQQVPKYHFSDLSAKITHRLNSQNSIHLSYYYAIDKYSGLSSSSNNMNLSWGSSLFSVCWKSILSSGTFLTATIYETNYNFSKTSFLNNNPIYPSLYGSSSNVNERSAIVAFESLIHRHKIKYGGQLSWFRMQPEALSKYTLYPPNLSIDTTFSARYKFRKQCIFAEDIITLTRNLMISIGVNVNRHVADRQDIISIHPRISFGYDIIPVITLKGSLCSMQQSQHLLQSSSLGSPSDLWVPSIRNIRPANATLYVAGVNYHSFEHWEINCEAFYKKMNRLIMFREGVNAYFNPTLWESLVESGRGSSKGVELTISRKQGIISGWISYTLSKTERKFENVNLGRTFPYNFDRRHVLNIVTIVQISKKIKLGSTWQFMTGHPVTLSLINVPDETSGYDGGYKYISGLNNFRLPNYHRLDMNINYHTKYKKIGMEFNIGAYNIYNRANPFYVSRGPEGITVTYLFPVLPYFNLTFKF